MLKRKAEMTHESKKVWGGKGELDRLIEPEQTQLPHCRIHLSIARRGSLVRETSPGVSAPMQSPPTFDSGRLA